MLIGDRCVNELLRLAEIHREIQFLLAGKLVMDSIPQELQPRLVAETPANLLLQEGFLDEKTLNSVIQAADAVLIDGANYPVHSSIATKALFFGKYLLTPDSNSWMRDVIQTWKTGMAYKSRDTDLVSAWREWQASGGPDNSRRAAAALMDEKELSKRFSELTRALTYAG